MWNMLIPDCMQRLRKANHKCNYCIHSIGFEVFFVCVAPLSLCTLSQCCFQIFPHFSSAHTRARIIAWCARVMLYKRGSLFNRKCRAPATICNKCFNAFIVLFIRAYPVYVNDYASGTQQQYYTTNDSYTTSSNHQNETYIVPVEDTLLSSQSRESPQTLSSVSFSREQKTPICFRQMSELL